MFKIIAILIGVLYACRILVWPIIVSGRLDKVRQKDFDLVKHQLKRAFGFLLSNRYRKTIEIEKRDCLCIEYSNQLRDRKLRLKLGYGSLRIDLVDKGYFAISIIDVFQDIGSPIDMKSSLGNGWAVSKHMISVVSEKLEKELDSVESYQSYRNLAYYYDILKKVKSGAIPPTDAMTIFSWSDAAHQSFLTKEFCTLCIQESDIVYAEMALTLNALMPIVEDRDLTYALSMVYAAVHEIGKDSKELILSYAEKDFNTYKNQFLSFAYSVTGTCTFESLGWELERRPSIALKSKYYREMDSFENWYSLGNTSKGECRY